MKFIIIIITLFIFINSFNCEEDINRFCIGVQNGYFVPSPSACDSFYVCVDGIAQEGKCPPPMLFNPYGKICDLPFNVICDQVTPPTTQSTTTSTTTTTTTTTPPSTTTRTTTRATTPQPIEIEPNLFCSHSLNLIFLASSIDCERYFICYNGEALRMQCTPGLHWNHNLKRCDYPESANCQIISIQPLPSCPNSGTKFFPHPSVCQYFIYCENGALSVQQCPFYHYWDIKTQKCLIKSVATCATIDNISY